MNNFKTKIAILAISFVSFVGIQSASAVEGMSIGAAYNYSGFMATGKETQGGTTTITEEDGAFMLLCECVCRICSKWSISLGLERHLEDITTPQNQNEKNGKNNLVKATLKIIQLFMRTLTCHLIHTLS